MARYYPNGSNRPKNKDNPLAPGNDKNDALENNGVSEWLYEEDWSKEKLHQYELLSTLPPVNAYFNYLLDLRADQEYLNRYGMDYSDIHDPRKLKQTTSGITMYRTGLNYVSKNLDKLYK